MASLVLPVSEIYNFKGASLTLVLWDYLLTVDTEYRTIWRNKAWSKSWLSFLFTILLVVNRYGQIGAQVAHSYLNSRSTPNAPSFCHSVSPFELVGIGIAQMLITDCIIWLAVSALYGHKKIVRYPLLILFFISSASIVIVYTTASRETGTMPDEISDINPCGLLILDTTLWLACLPIIGYEGIMLFLITYQVYVAFRDRTYWLSALTRLVLHEIVVHLLAIISMAIVNAIIFSKPSITGLSNEVVPLTAAVFSVVGNRMLFNIRSENETNDDTKMTTMEFATLGRDSACA